MVADWSTQFSEAELQMIRTIAQRDGVTVEQAADRLAADWLRRTVKRKTGRAPARIYTLSRPGSKP